MPDRTRREIWLAPGARTGAGGRVESQTFTTGARFVSPPLDHAGTTEYLQAFIVDPKTPGGLSATDALRIRWAD